MYHFGHLTSDQCHLKRKHYRPDMHMYIGEKAKLHAIIILFILTKFLMYCVTMIRNQSVMKLKKKMKIWEQLHTEP